MLVDEKDIILQTTQQVIDFEAILLHAIIYQHKIPEAELNPEDFIDHRNRQIYRIILDCLEKGLQPDIVNIGSLWMDYSKKSTKYIIDLSYLTELTFSPDIFDVNIVVARLKYQAKERQVNKILNEKIQQGNLDVSELIIDLEKLESNVESLTSEQLAAKVFEELLLRQNGDLKTFRSGFKSLDFITGGFVGGEYIILAGRTSQGKTAAALSILYNQCILKGHSGAYITVEMSDKQLLNRLTTMKTGILISKLKTGDVNEWELADVREFLDQFTKSKAIINHAVRLTASELRRRVKGFVKQGAEFVVLDYIQKLVQKASTREREISILSETCKNLAMEYDIPFIVLAQLNRNLELTDREPELSDLRESGSLEQDADMVIFVHRKKSDDLGKDEMAARLLLKKNRNGAIGTADVEFVKSRALFRDKQF
jgi:replicative DNA helicase